MSFISNFMTWTGGTEVPENYLFWSGMSALSSLVGGRVWSKQGRFTIHPNLYVVLLGPPHSGKTAAKRAAEKVVRSFPDIPISVESETKESLTRFMRDQCKKELVIPGATEMIEYTPITIMVNELSNFLGPNSGHMIDFLTGIWDCADDAYGTRTKNKGEDILIRPYVNLLSCTTQEWITSYLKTDIIGGGFSRRVIFVNEPEQDDEKRVPRPEYSPEQHVARQNLESYGEVLLQVAGEMQWDKDAYAAYDRWYYTRSIPRDPDVRGFHKSKPTLVFKLAPLIALSEKPDLRVTKEDFETALVLLERTERNLGKVFQGLGRNELNAIATQALDFMALSKERAYRPTKDSPEVKAGRMCLEKELTNHLFRNAPYRDCKDIMEYLTSSGKVIPYEIPHPKSGSKMRFLILASSVRSLDKTEIEALEKGGQG